MSSLKTGPSTPGLQILAIPAVCLLVLFLGYFSQWLFYISPDLAPGPLTTADAVTFNTLLLGLWWTYYKACTVDPGRYHTLPTTAEPPSTPTPTAGPATATAPRWCKKCRQPKPPRAHHCRHCGRCVPKMDHHCPWTGNCVSLQTFPHFFRFLVYTNISLWALLRLLFQRGRALWSTRSMPAYLGPTTAQLVGLTVLSLVCAATALALGIMLFTATRGWVLNTTMIEGWEVERHEALLTRYDHGEEDDDDDGGRTASGPWELQPVEFPYDLGMFDNMAQAMGTRNVLLWFFPFAGGPAVSPTGSGTGWEWEENGFNAAEGMWPPVDPEKARRAVMGWPGAASRMGAAGPGHGFRDYGSPEATKAEFQRRQLEDLRRRGQLSTTSGIVAELEEVDDLYDAEYEGNDYRYYEQGMDGEPGWTNSDGDRLRDYGVDEEAEDEELIPHDLDEDVPIAELLRRRKVLKREDDGDT